MIRIENAKRSRAKANYQLPSKARTRDGFEYDPRAESWRVITEDNKLNLHFGDLGNPPALLTAYKGFIMNQLRSCPPRTVQSVHFCARRLLKHIASQDPAADFISPAHLANFRASLSETRLRWSTEANDAIRAWAKLNIPGVTREAIAYALELQRHRCEGGRAVRLHCPIHGPYSNLEYDGLYKALHAAFADGKILIADYGLCLLNGSLGARPVQLAALKLCDLKVSDGHGGRTYTLSVPRAKQRGGRRRAHFTDRPLIEELGMVIEAQAKLVRASAQASNMLAPEQAPMFPARAKHGTFYGDGLRPASPTPETIMQRIVRVMEKLGVMSERTGRPINATATRARRTVATRAALEGKSLEDISAILDHTTLASAHIYIEIRSELLQRLDENVSLHLAPLAQRFAGRIVPRGSDAVYGVQRHVLGVAEGGEGPTDIGGCGKYGFCGLAKPIACYTCRLFQPWVDGPHEAIWRGLMERRERLALAGSEMVAASLDDTIVACAEVVRQCRAKAATLEGPTSD